MNFNKIILFSMALFSTSSLFPSEAASSVAQCIKNEALDVYEIPLVPKKYALTSLDELLNIRQILRYHEAELVKKAHLAERNSNIIWANIQNVKHYIEERKRQGATQEAIAMLEQQVNELTVLGKETHDGSLELLSQMCKECSTRLLVNQRNACWLQAVLLRSEKEELIQKQSAMQLKINQLESARAKPEPRLAYDESSCLVGGSTRE